MKKQRKSIHADQIAEKVIWDKIRRSASIWYKTHDIVKEVTLANMQRD